MCECFQQQEKAALMLLARMKNHEAVSVSNSQQKTYDIVVTLEFVSAPIFVGKPVVYYLCVNHAGKARIVLSGVHPSVYLGVCLHKN